MIKIDLHTHSHGSPDGGLQPHHYQYALETGLLDCIAITDHDTIDAAKRIHQMVGHKIIIGEEITTADGELIGLFLTHAVPAGLSAKETAEAIHAQGGLVYVPHPFETVRKGITPAALDGIMELVDIVETNNGRAVFQNMGPRAAMWARLHHKPGAASSDAHGFKGVGRTYTEIAEMPSKETLAALLHKGRLTTRRPPLVSLLYPKANRLKKRWKAVR